MPEIMYTKNLNVADNWIQKNVFNPFNEKKEIIKTEIIRIKESVRFLFNIIIKIVEVLYRKTESDRSAFVNYSDELEFIDILLGKINQKREYIENFPVIDEENILFATGLDIESYLVSFLKK